MIATGWSGHLDFLNVDDCLLLGGEVKQIPKSAHWENIMIPESGWLEVDESHAYNALNQVFLDYDPHKTKAKKLGKVNREKFTINKMNELLNSMVDKYTSGMSTEVKLNLPKLQLKKEAV